MELVLAGLVLVTLIGYLGYDHHVRKKEEAVAEAQRLERRAKRVANTKKETKKAVALEQGQAPPLIPKTKPPAVDSDVTINGPWFDVVETPVAPTPLPETPPLAKAPIQPPLEMSFDDSSNVEHVVESEDLIQTSEVNPTDPPQDFPPSPPLPVTSTLDPPLSVSNPIRMDAEEVSRETHSSVVETQSADSLAETNSSQAVSPETEESKSDFPETILSKTQDEIPDLVKTPALLDLPSLESIRPDLNTVHLPSDSPPVEIENHSSSVDEFSEFLNQPTNLPFEGLSHSNDFIDLIEPPSNLLESNAAAVPTVLFVDDSKMVREQMRNIFEEAGCRALLMTDGRDVMTFFSNPHEPVDLIFSDVEMKHVGGFELYQHLQSNSETASIPFVFVTGSMDNVRKGESLGCKHALLKPYNERHIQVLFEQLLPAFFTN
jgi:CheY-like chemotaxis protein